MGIQNVIKCPPGAGFIKNHSTSHPKHQKVAFECPANTDWLRSEEDHKALLIVGAIIVLFKDNRFIRDIRN